MRRPARIVLVSLFIALTGCQILGEFGKLPFYAIRYGLDKPDEVDLSNLDRLYLSESIINDSIAAVVVSPVDRNLSFSANQIEFSRKAWTYYYFSEGTRADKLRGYFQGLHSQLVRIVTSRQSEKTLDFTYPEFHSFVASLEPQTSVVRIYDNGYMTLYSRAGQNLYVIPIPRVDLKTIDELLRPE